MMGHGMAKSILKVREEKAHVQESACTTSMQRREAEEQSLKHGLLRQACASAPPSSLFSHPTKK